MSLLWSYVLVHTFCKGKTANVGLAKLSVSCFVVAPVGSRWVGWGMKGLVFKCTKVAFLGKTAGKKLCMGSLSCEGRDCCINIIINKK